MAKNKTDVVLVITTRHNGWVGSKSLNMFRHRIINRQWISMI